MSAGRPHPRSSPGLAHSGYDATASYRRWRDTWDFASPGERERTAIVFNDIEAIDRVLDTCGYQGELEGRTPRAARIVLFYRSELRGYLLAELRKAGELLTARELAVRVCHTEGKDGQDR